MYMYNLYKTLKHKFFKVTLSNERKHMELHLAWKARQTLTLQQSDHSAQYLFDRKMQMKE